MTPENEALVVDLLAWLADGPRPYDEVMAAWRTTCPRLTIWEDALDAGFVRVERGGTTATVHATDDGRAWLAQRRKSANQNSR